MKRKIIILDTTLRDGEQALKYSLTAKKKLKIALSLENMGVDIIEVGFPISSPEDFKSSQIISNNITNSTICSLARCVDNDIEVAAESMLKAKNFRLHIFLATSDIHIKSKLKKRFQEIIDMSVFYVKKAKKYTNDVQFSCEDAGRTNINNLCKIVEKVIEAGANTINIPDTVGFTVPYEFGKIIKYLYNNVPNIDKANISVHCHNDLGMASGNSISAIKEGASQVEGTTNGLGERAGNTALEEIIMAIKLHGNLLNAYTDINIKNIYKNSKLVSKICHVPIPRNKAVIGSNAFSHSSGIHQDGMLKNRNNYEIFNPTIIGFKKTKLNLTSRSGRSAIKQKMLELGYKEKDYDLNKLYNKFINFADKKGKVFDYDLEYLAFKNEKEYKNFFLLKKYSVNYKLRDYTKLKIKLLCGDKIKNIKITTKKNIINVLCKLFSKTTMLKIVLLNYESFTTEKIENLSIRVNISVKYKNRTFYGTGISKNYLESYILSLIDVLNNIWNLNDIYMNLKKNIF
ncbi:2-isopropylmalate synthase [Buchnera aphidicola (Taiwanaphis decaspermi)]|uniref:2-isopropylmalate synthase n=1 Tax=Buchnera aphidicola TaxID=9 RepID=UPI0031B86C15